MSDDSRDEGRTIEKVIELGVSSEDLWRALTEAEALASWFPLEAEVEPGEGGSIRLGWGDYFEGLARIEIWEPGRHLRTTWEMGAGDPGDPTGREETETPADQGTSGSLELPRQDDSRPARLVVDYFIEGGSDRTRLRLVHSGFGRGADWDEWYEGTRRGWDFQLCCLRHWLERHPGGRRQVAWARRRTSLEGREAWSRLLGSGGLVVEGELSGLAAGDSYRVLTAQGDELSGTVQLRDPSRQLAVTVDELDDALLRIAEEEMADAAELQLFLCAWDVDVDEIAALEKRWQRLLDDLLPSA